MRHYSIEENYKRDLVPPDTCISSANKQGQYASDNICKMVTYKSNTFLLRAPSIQKVPPDDLDIKTRELRSRLERFCSHLHTWLHQMVCGSVVLLRESLAMLKSIVKSNILETVISEALLNT